MTTLTKSQYRVYQKLNFDWQNSYELQENRNTLNSLVKLGLADKKMELGYLFMPKIKIYYRKKERTYIADLKIKGKDKK